MLALICGRLSPFLQAPILGRIQTFKRLQPNFLGTHADVDEEHVYLITKTIYENLPFLNGIHPATKVMALEKAIDGLPAPLHPGAARYYQEQGLNIPARLIAN